MGNVQKKCMVQTLHTLLCKLGLDATLQQQVALKHFTNIEIPFFLHFRFAILSIRNVLVDAPGDTVDNDTAFLIFHCYTSRAGLKAYWNIDRS